MSKITVTTKNSRYRQDRRIRSSPHLVIYFQGGKIIVENYLVGTRFHGTQDTVLLLDYFQSWKTVRQATKSLAREFTRASILRSIKNLGQNGLLISEDSEQDQLARKFSDEWLWPTPSRYYHFSTKLREPYSTSDEIRRFYEKNLRGKSQPSIYKSYRNIRKIKLPSVRGSEAPLFETMRRRHTTRSFSGAAISLSQLSRMAYYTWGRVSTIKTKEFGRLLHKASPSAGARHPIEAYAVVNNVEGVNQGIYHYSVRDHSLELLKSGDFRQDCERFAAGQSWTKNASVLFIMTAIVSRTAWKYRIPRVYRALLLDAGHLSQTFLLVASALDLGAFCIGIIGDFPIEKELNLDGVNEIALFAVGVGQPANAARTQFPAD